MQQCIKIFIIPCLHEAQHVLGDTSPVIRSLKLHWKPLVFHTWKVIERVVGGRAHCAWQRLPTTRPTTFHVWKTRGCRCSFSLLMMGGVSPETCWASYKYRIIKILIDYCILLDFFLYEFYYDARIREHQGKYTVCFSCLLLLHWKLRNLLCSHTSRCCLPYSCT